MEQTTALSIIDSIDTNIVTRTMDKIHSFQQIIHQAVVPGHDIGIIPGTDKPTLLKPGAEKIVMMMGLSSRYEIMDKVEDYDKGFFAYNLKCVLSRNGLDICEGVGNCNSREKKYVNQDPYSIANTILKMAKKRAYVDASLSVASLSDIFTQDIEDMDSLRIVGGGASHRDNQGKSLKDTVVTFGKHKGRTLGDLLANEPGWIEWYAEKGNNETWKQSCKRLMEEEKGGTTMTDIGEPPESKHKEAKSNGNRPTAGVVRMATNAGMTEEDLLAYVEAEYHKPWADLSGEEKSAITKHLQELKQQAG